MLFKQLKPFAGYDPYLLTCALKKETLDKSIAKCYWATVRYVQRTSPSAEDNLLFVKHVEDITKYFHSANQY